MSRNTELIIEIYLSKYAFLDVSPGDASFFPVCDILLLLIAFFMSKTILLVVFS